MQSLIAGSPLGRAAAAPRGAGPRPAATRLVAPPRQPARRGIVARSDLASTTFTLLEYEYVWSGDELVQKREPWMAEHLRVLREAVSHGGGGGCVRLRAGVWRRWMGRFQAASGKLWMFGPVNEPISGGLLVWKETSEEDIRAFMQTDPFYTQGVVKSWTLRPYYVVGGAGGL
ncbi:hypothetical protein CHLNCDRAFT_144589 [Chlorella variabilis]|uniref:YCII-related domain-containing protein n=1 Tax=Chlorella variabilis TaxID=554065 RepID=E1ZBR9_CHLVA|nr:hypothetical protein CHLNCDRAFT_144589 [Chlorella variabilis]EFN56688.1 hypothetical protein CHLNCDRAFT_144589 [Chlorella variabilis]|eukprot:XP_005848790.1 hypothetical protein CHLNCDRAFT_144589 [Chlorella variabilis]